VTQSEGEVSEIVQHKVRRAVARRGLQQIRQLIDRWREEEAAGKKLWRATLIGLLLLVVVVVCGSLSLRSEVRVVSGNDMSNPGTTMR
jgi:hypothetical protein